MTNTLIKRAKKNSILMKAAPEFKEWIEKRRSNMQKLIPLPNVKVTLMDTQRIIAKSDGVALTPQMIKKLKEASR